MFGLSSKSKRLFSLVKDVLQDLPQHHIQCRLKSTILTEKSQNNIIISCKRKKYNFYENHVYKKFDEVPLATKGWAHSKAKGDYFVVHPDLTTIDKPSHSFEQIALHPQLINALNELKITNATNLQSEVIPIIRSGKHTSIHAETGCGKTLSYLLPIIEKLIEKHTQTLNTPKALILVPNRELAHQIGAVAKHLAEAVGLKVAVIVGGNTKKIMLNPTFSDIDLLIGTPGAIGKLSTVGIYKLNEVQYAVLDEADTLIDDSFAERMESLLRRASQSQVLLVSATAPKYLPSFLEPYKDNMAVIKSPRLHRPLRTVTQRFLRLTKSNRPSQLLLIAKHSKDPLLVFTNRNETCNWLAMFLRENGISCANINGDMNNFIRIEQWRQFVKGEAQVLSATDVGSRGLDTTQVRHVLNYDFPLYAADYIHRVGRTGRLGSHEVCKVTNFVSGEQEIKLVQQIEVNYVKSIGD